MKQYYVIFSPMYDDIRRKPNQTRIIMVFILDGCPFMLRTYDVNKVFFRRKKKIGFDDSFDVTKCLQQIEMPDLLHICA